MEFSPETARICASAARAHHKRAFKLARFDADIVSAVAPHQKVVVALGVFKAVFIGDAARMLHEPPVGVAPIA